MHGEGLTWAGHRVAHRHSEGTAWANGTGTGGRPQARLGVTHAPRAGVTDKQNRPGVHSAPCAGPAWQVDTPSTKGAAGSWGGQRRPPSLLVAPIPRGAGDPPSLPASRGRGDPAGRGLQETVLAHQPLDSTQEALLGGLGKAYLDLPPVGFFMVWLWPVLLMATLTPTEPRHCTEGWATR